uniref:Uncharacterized protein n=1 Tax=Callorhinchus milii TaxID=7868 RepID=A0A4W3IW44_CALMI
MRGWQAGVCSLLGAALDVSVTTVLYIHGTEYQRFSADLRRFSVSRSFLDLWAACVLRLCLLSGAGLGVCLNPAQGPGRLGRWAGWLRLLFGLVPLYATVKLLLYSDSSAFPHDPWFWSLLAWTYLSSLATFVALKLSCVKPASAVVRSESSGRSDEERSLLDSEEQGNTGIKVSAVYVVWRVLAFCKQDACLLAAAFVFLLIGVLCEIFIPFFLGRVLEAIVAQKTNHVLSLSPRLPSPGSSGLTGGFREGAFNVAFARLNVRIRRLLLTSLLQQEIAFFDCNHTGDMTSRLTSDTTVVSDVISQNANIFLRSLVKTLGICALMITLSWKLTVVTVIGFPVIIQVSDIYSQHYKALAKEVQDALAKANHIAEEAISCIKTVRSFAAEGAEERVYNEQLSRMYALNKREALASAYFTWATKFLQLALQCSIIYYGGFLVLSNSLTSASLISFIIYELALGDCLQVSAMGMVFTSLVQAVGVMEKILEIIDRKSAMSRDGTLAPETLKGEVTFRNVTFSYPSRPEVPVLNDVCFTLSPGEVTALVGPSGSGKSSCVHLMERFYSPHAGEVLLDGLPLPQYQSQYLHSQVALVGQEPVLFARSIEENITYGMEQASSADSVTEAARKANAHDFIMEMKDGYSTETGEKGAQLSGGQKQRVAIARALVRSPRVLLLDEATSALDAESDHKVQEALYSIKENCTVLIIAHRLSTVEKADKIIVIDKGSVVEQGSHKELMRKGGLYFTLVQWQTLGLENSPEDKLVVMNH